MFQANCKEIWWSIGIISWFLFFCDEKNFIWQSISNNLIGLNRNYLKNFIWSGNMKQSGWNYDIEVITIHGIEFVKTESQILNKVYKYFFVIILSSI